ncbi:seipin-1 [Salvia miltiorrhiza]|uniref:seipin-1 n=1 Tax=Salvia miltiorrhiza TaxID=226208 RepID=UPI0025AC3512|nr:seipin-1 [Salvia miltiorrhiza]
MDKCKLPNPFIFCTKLLPSAMGASLLGRMATGVAAAAYVLMALMVAMVAAAVVGVGLVRWWAEEPLYVKESVQFDYSDAHPTALLTFGNGPAVPPGHTVYVSLSLLMPDSDYNRDVGIFQLSAELISGQGNVIARSSHPSMLRFRSWPIRYARTFLMGVPLVLGMTSETQRVTFPVLKHKEAAYPRTEDIRLTLIPRAGTSSLPQFYDAEVVVHSRPPWLKEVVHRWRLTFCVWTSLYVFVILVVFLVLLLKPLIFPVTVAKRGEEEESREAAAMEKREVSESLERWQTRRSKRKAALLEASSITLGTCSLQEGTGDSESVSS